MKRSTRILERNREELATLVKESFFTGNTEQDVRNTSKNFLVVDSAEHTIAVSYVGCSCQQCTGFERNEEAVKKILKESKKNQDISIGGIAFLLNL